MKKSTKRCLFYRWTALLLTLIMCGGTFNIPTPAANEITRNASIVENKSDGNTSDEWRTALANNTAGYVWTDKTVKTAADNDSFDITYSTIGKSEESKLEIDQPVDLVLVIDHSGSMGNVDVASGAEEKDSRMRKMVQAINETIDDVMKNPYNRVSVVMFHDYYTVLLPLDHYTRLDYSDPIVQKDKDRFGSGDEFKTNGDNKVDYIQILYHWDNRNNPYDPSYYYNLGAYAKGDKNGKISPIADDSRFATREQKRTSDGKSKYLDDTKYFSSSGSTNIQAGIYKGMDILLDSAKDKENIIEIPGATNTIKRQPSLVLMTDGGATNILSGDPWNLTDEAVPVGFASSQKNPTYGINKYNQANNTITVSDGDDYHKYLRAGAVPGAVDDYARQETTAILLATLMTAAYYEGKVKAAYNDDSFSVSAIAMDMNANDPGTASSLEWLRSSILFNPSSRFDGEWAHGTSTSTLERDRNNNADSSDDQTGWQGKALDAIIKYALPTNPNISRRNWRWNTWWADQAYNDYTAWFGNNKTFTYEYHYGSDPDFYVGSYSIAQPTSIAQQTPDDVRNMIDENIHTWLYNKDNNVDHYSPYYLDSSSGAVDAIKDVFAKAYDTSQKVTVPISPVLPSSSLTYTDTIGAGMHIDGGITLDTNFFNIDTNSKVGKLNISLDSTGIGNIPAQKVKNSFGQSVNLSSITVKVSPVSVTGNSKQTITITIPENLVPVKIGNDETFNPLKFTYKVKLNDDREQTATNGQKFYSNDSATTTFTPSGDNHFYETNNTPENWDTPKNGTEDINNNNKPADDQEYKNGIVTVAHDNNGVIKMDLTVDLTFHKVSADGTTPLSGATFALTHDNSCTCGGTVVAIDNQTSITSGDFTFAKVPAGHTYTLTEISAPTGYQKPADPLATVTVDNSGTVSITDESSGLLVDNYKIKNMFEPTYTSLTVNKEWKNDKSSNRPTSIEVQLLKDGIADGDPVELKSSDNWSHTWNDLVTMDENGTTYSYSVEEVNVPDGYTATVSRIDNGTITITNTFTDAYLTIEKYIDKLYYYSTATEGDNPHGFGADAGIGKIGENDNHGYLGYTQAEQNFVFEVKKYKLDDTEYKTPLSTSYVVLKFGADANRLVPPVEVTSGLSDNQYYYKDSTRVKVERGYSYVVTEVGTGSGLSWRYECDCMGFSTDSGEVTAVLRLEKEEAQSGSVHKNGNISINYKGGGEATVSFYNSRTSKSETIESDMSSIKNNIKISL